MKFIKENWQYILLFLLFAILAWFFPNTGMDWYFGNANNFDNPLDLLKSSSGNIIFSMLVFLITNIKILKVIIYAGVTTGLFLLIRNTINKKNNSLIYMGIFLFLIVSLNIWKSSFVNATNFASYFIGTFLTLLVMNFISGNKFKDYHPLVYLILGVVTSTISPIFTILIFIISLYLFAQKVLKGNAPNSYLCFFLGSSLGVVLNLLAFYINNSSLNIPNISQNVLNNIVPSLMQSNFIVVLITISFLLFLSIKIFLRSEKFKQIKVVGSMISLALYAFIILFSKYSTLNYMMFILYLIASLYLFINITNSRLFKSRILLYYVLKVLYIVLISLFEFSVSSLIFPFVIDIMLILELINYVMPLNFLKYVWFSVVCSFLVVDIYVYVNVYKENKEMNKFIASELKNSNNEIEVPLRYETDYLYHYLPSKEEKEYYIRYFDIETDMEFNIYFN